MGYGGWGRSAEGLGALLENVYNGNVYDHAQYPDFSFCWHRIRSGTNSPYLGGTKSPKIPPPTKLMLRKTGDYRIVRYFDRKTHTWLEKWKPIYAYRLVFLKRKKSPKPKRPPRIYKSPNSFAFENHRLWGITSAPLFAVLTGNPLVVRRVTGPTGVLSVGFWGGGSPPHPENDYTYAGPRLAFYSTELAALEQKALGKMYDKIKNQSVNLANVAVEAHKTIEMIGLVSSRVLSAVLAFKHGNWSKLKSLLPWKQKEVAGDWLQLQYGIRPLMSDIEGLMKEINGSQVLARVHKYTATASEPIKREDSFTLTGALPCKGSIKYSGQLTVKYKVEAQITSELLSDLNRLGLTNLTTAAWEIVPWSFVVDWFLPIGDFLNRLDSLQGWQILSITRTTFIKAEVVMSAKVGGPASDGFIWSEAEIGWKKSYVECKREVLTSLPSIPFPSFKSPLSVGHAANALALFTQLTAKRG